MRLARRAWEAPATLVPGDLTELRELVGDDALDFAMVLVGFHHINRMADLLHVDPEALPESLRRFEWLRRLGVRVSSRIMGRMDLRNRPYESSFDEAVVAIRPLLPRALADRAASHFAALRTRPKVIEALHLSLDERVRLSTLEPATLARVQRACENALPAGREDIEGFHPRPADPVEAFAFVGTRYPARTSEAMIDALRRSGYDDEGILDLAVAVADANLWARLHRLVGLDARLLYVDPA